MNQIGELSGSPNELFLTDTRRSHIAAAGGDVGTEGFWRIVRD